MDEGDEGGWAVDRPEWHDIVSPLRSVWSGKGQFLLRVLSDANLMIALGSIPHPVREGRAKGKVDCGIATRDDICNYLCDLIERDVIYAKSPDEVVDDGDVFLMRFRGKESLNCHSPSWIWRMWPIVSSAAMHLRMIGISLGP